MPGAQGLPAYGCDSPESKQFDFWVGRLGPRYTDEGKTATSHNHVTKILDGCAILEEFTGAPGTRLGGRSISTFDRATRQWKQTWIDNTATLPRLHRRLRRRPHDPVARGRSVGPAAPSCSAWCSRTSARDSLKWLWQRSDDAGRTWTTHWEIEYTRAK